MTAAQPQGLTSRGVRSLEVRWIFPGPLAPAMAGWFGRFPARVETRQDSYLLDPDLGGLSVKVRAGQAFEVKMYRGSPGTLEVTGRARGRIQSWQKWSFPLGPLRQGSGKPAGWRPVAKARRIARFRLDGGRAVAGGPGPAGEPGCTVELTEVRMGGQAWWSLGFEATGPAGLLRSRLQATAVLVFAHDLPGGVELGTDNSRSYAEWLGQTARNRHLRHLAKVILCQATSEAETRPSLRRERVRQETSTRPVPIPLATWQADANGPAMPRSSGTRPSGRTRAIRSVAAAISGQ